VRSSPSLRLCLCCIEPLGVRVKTGPCCARGGGERHVTPERELHSNLRLLSVNLLKTKQLRENPFDPVAVEKPPG
jgi:hypothetical protein